MAFDRNGNELFEYTFAVARKAVIDGRDEFGFLYNDNEYYISVSNKYMLKDYYKQKDAKRYTKDNKINLNREEPDWCCFDIIGKILLIAPRTVVMDNIIIDGHYLKDIWSQITII